MTDFLAKFKSKFLLLFLSNKCAILCPTTNDIPLNIEFLSWSDYDSAAALTFRPTLFPIFFSHDPILHGFNVHMVRSLHTDLIDE